MKKFLLLIFVFIICSNVSFSQYIQQKSGEIWGANEKKYASLGDKAVSFIKQDLYSLAIDCFEEMLAINCKNADRHKDYYSMIYCYFRLDDYHSVLNTCNLYLNLPNKSIQDRNINQVYFYQGFSYLELNAPQKAVLSFENAIAVSAPDDYHSLFQNHHLAGKCYYMLDNNYLATKNYKKAICYCCIMTEISIEGILKYDQKDFGLGMVLYDYSIIKKGEKESYQDWLYLLLLAAKCEYPQAQEEAREFNLLEWEHLPKPSSNLFYSWP